MSKVVDNSDASALDRFNVTEGHFTSSTDKQAFRFVREYAALNRGKAPSYAALVEKIPEFNYIPAVEDDYLYLTRRLFNEAADDELANFINGETKNGPTLAQLYEEHRDNMPELFEKLSGVLQDIAYKTDVRDKVGFDVKRDFESFFDEYRRRKSGESIRIWDSRYNSVGSYTSGNLTVFFGKSGRGKSVVTLSDAIFMAEQGANVLIWGMEMSTFEILVRIYSIISADLGIQSDIIDGIDMAVGFDTTDLRNGELPEAAEAELIDFLRSLNTRIKGNITLRGADDENFNDRSIRALEADITQTSADVVLIDAFYHMDYEANKSRTTGGDAAETSRILRRMAGSRKVVIMAITQADEAKEEIDDDGGREMTLPIRGDVKKTKSLLEDAHTLVAIDTDYKQGRGLVGVVKGRDGGEGDITELLYIPQRGLCRPLQGTEASIDDFNEF